MIRKFHQLLLLIGMPLYVFAGRFIDFFIHLIHLIYKFSFLLEFSIL
jgi:hypothetical protein